MKKYRREENLSDVENFFSQHIFEAKQCIEQNSHKFMNAAELIQMLFQPSCSESNLKLFGGKLAIENERRRAKKGGMFVIHPCSKFRWVLLLGFKVSYIKIEVLFA